MKTSFFLKLNKNYKTLDDSQDSKGSDTSYDSEAFDPVQEKQKFDTYEKLNRPKDVTNVTWETVYVKVFSNFINKKNFKSVGLVLSAVLKSKEDIYNKTFINNQLIDILNRDSETDLYMRRILTRFNNYSIKNCAYENLKQKRLNENRLKSRNSTINYQVDEKQVPFRLNLFPKNIQDDNFATIEIKNRNINKQFSTIEAQKSTLAKSNLALETVCNSNNISTLIQQKSNNVLSKLGNSSNSKNCNKFINFR